MDDFKIDLLNYNTHDRINYFIDINFPQGFIPRIHKPSMLTDYSHTLIDHISSIYLQAKSTIIKDIADHFATYHIVQNKVRNNTGHVTTKRIFSIKFKHYLSKLIILPFSIKFLPEEAYENFLQIYKKEFGFPLKRIRCKNIDIKTEQWMTEGPLTAMPNNITYFKRNLKILLFIKLKHTKRISTNITD